MISEDWDFMKIMLVWNSRYTILKGKVKAGDVYGAMKVRSLVSIFVLISLNRNVICTVEELSLFGMSYKVGGWQK